MPLSAALAAGHGTVEAFLEAEHGIDAQALGRLRSLLLEP